MRLPTFYEQNLIPNWGNDWKSNFNINNMKNDKRTAVYHRWHWLNSTSPSFVKSVT